MLIEKVKPRKLHWKNQTLSLGIIIFTKSFNKLDADYSHKTRLKQSRDYSLPRINKKFCQNTVYLRFEVQNYALELTKDLKS